MEYFSKIIHVDYDENAHSVIERFLTLEDHDIIFTIPTGAVIFENVSDLKLLKQAIDKSGKNIVIVSQDDAGMELAKDLGFRVEQEFLELIAPDENSHKYSADTHKHPRISDILYPQKEKRSSLSSRKVIIEEAKPEESEEYQEEEQIEPIEKTQPPTRDGEGFLSPKAFEAKKEILPKKPAISMTLVISLFVVVAMGVAGVAAMIILPEATLNIVPKKETVILDIPIKADTSLSETSIETNAIPGQIVKVEKEEEFQFNATGKSTGESKATGKITIYNEYTPPQSQTLVKTTRFQSADGKIFRTTANVIVPAAKTENGKTIPGTIEVAVVADGAGAEYNISPSEFSIPGLAGTPKAKAIYGKSTSTMQGGSRGEGLMVTLDDINNAKTQAENELIEAVKNELKEKLPKDLEIADDSIETKILEEKISAQAGQTVEKFTINLKVSAMAFLFQEEDIKTLIEKNIETKLMRDKITYKDFRKNYKDIEMDFSAGIMSLVAHVEQDIAAFVDVESLKNSVAGKNEEEVREIILNESSIEAAHVSMRPKFILKKIPSDTDKINIVIGE